MKQTGSTFHVTWQKLLNVCEFPDYIFLSYDFRETEFLSYAVSVINYTLHNHW